MRDFIEGIDLGTFESDLKLFYAVTRALEIISEASRRLPEEVKAEHAGIPWRAIRDAGNAHRHGYDNIEATYIWDTVQDDIPKLSVVIDEVLAADDKIRQTEPPP